MLGLFDSGLGGLTVLRPLRSRLPSHDILYLGDQANVPYGDRTPEELLGFLRANLAYLNQRGARGIVVACNTSCAVAARFGWPPSEAPVLDLIQNAAGAVAAAGVRHIGVIATSATARSGAYGEALRTRIPGAEVQEIAAPALVPLVERGELESPRTRAAVAEACAQLSRQTEAVVYGCTHYPLLDAHFAASLGGGVLRLDPALAQADAAAALVAARSVPPGSGKVEYVTTGDPEAFRAAVRGWTGEAEPRVTGLHQAHTRR